MGFRQASITSSVASASSALTITATTEAGIQHMARSISVTVSASSASVQTLYIYDGTSSGTVLWRADVAYPSYRHRWGDPGIGATIANQLLATFPASTSTGTNHTMALEYVRRRVTASTS